MSASMTPEVEFDKPDAKLKEENATMAKFAEQRRRNQRSHQKTDTVY
jgi:hypothetical protein